MALFLTIHKTVIGFKDLTLFTGQNHSQQLDTISGLNSNPAYQNSAWGNWQLADLNEVSGLYNSLSDVDDFFVRSGTDVDSWPSYFTWWWGRYDSTIVLSDNQLYDIVMHWSYRTFPSGQYKDDWWGGLNNYILPTATSINVGTGLDADVGAWVTAEYISDYQPSQTRSPNPPPCFCLVLV